MTSRTACTAARAMAATNICLPILSTVSLYRCVTLLFMQSHSKKNLQNFYKIFRRIFAETFLQNSENILQNLLQNILQDFLQNILKDFGRHFYRIGSIVQYSLQYSTMLCRILQKDIHIYRIVQICLLWGSPGCHFHEAFILYELSFIRHTSFIYKWFYKNLYIIINLYNFNKSGVDGFTKSI